MEGADLVVHSATKYLGSHSDVTAGVIVGGEGLLAVAKSRIVNMGMNVSPFEVWLALRGIKTLSLRMKKQTESAGKVAAYLESRTRIWFSGMGAIVTFEIPEGVDVSTFYRLLGWIKIVPTLAGVETTVSSPYGTSHRELPEKDKKWLGITKRLVRMSIGIEAAEDIIEELKNALR